MPTHSQLRFGDESRTKLARGVLALAEAVRPTLEPESHSVLLQKQYGSPQVCDDGVTIAKRVELAHPEENLGDDGDVKEPQTRSPSMPDLA
ncbi:MAG: hypothetical protein OEY41_01625 [Acidimicrobiia bacterium]|nr:hypothetical protein [Acidimicrobiia bacterium]